MIKKLCLPTFFVFSASAFANDYDRAVELLYSLDDASVSVDLERLRDADQDIDLISLVDLYAPPVEKFDFTAVNKLPDVGQAKFAIKKLKCAYEYVDIFGNSTPVGGWGRDYGFSRVFGTAAILEADRPECVQGFACTYTVGVVGLDVEREFNPVKLNLIRDVGPEMKGTCFEAAKITIKPNQ